MDSNLYQIPFSRAFNRSHEATKQKLEFPALSLCPDSDHKEGIVGTLQGIYFFNTRHKFLTLLIGVPSQVDHVVQSVSIEGELLATRNVDGVV